MSCFNAIGNGMPHTHSNLFFKVSPVPEFPFLNKPFNVTISLLDDKGKVPYDIQDLHFTLSLVEDLLDPHNSSDFSHFLSLSTDNQYSFDTNGCCRLNLCFCELSAMHDCRKFILLVRYGSIFGVSTPMMSVRYRLESDPTISSPIIWFKDRGGKKNCIEVPVRLVSSEGINATGLIVPISVELIYADGESVPDQNLLEINRDGRLLMISNQTGECLLRIRIKEVSMRHKGKLFALKISPDILRAPHTKDISCTVSRFIEVRSKIAGLSFSSSTLNPTDNRSCQQMTSAPNSLPSIPMKRKNDQSDSEFAHNPIYSAFTVPAIGSVYPLQVPASSSTSIKKMCSFEPQSLDQDLPVQSSAAELPNFPVSASPQIGSLSDWAVNVVQQLERLKWKIVGREVPQYDPFQTTRPVYEMSNPNDVLEEIISQYYSLTHHFPREIENDSPISTLETSDEGDEDIFRELASPFF